MLDDLVEVIETLQRRIREHGANAAGKRNPHADGAD